MRIIFFSHYFPPEVNAPAVRTFDHCVRWASMGHEVHVITAIPSHPAGVPFPPYRKRWYQKEMVEGIHVHRVWTFLAANSGVALRVVNFLSFIPTSVWRAISLGRADVIVATSPQFFCAAAGCLAGAVTRTPWVMEVRDLWPESIPEVGAMKESVVLRGLRAIARGLYRHATKIVCLTRSFMDQIATMGISREKMAYVPNGIEPALWESTAGPTERQALGFGSDDVVVSYVGTLGMAHGLSTILDVAAQLRPDAPHVRFLIAGDGADGPALRTRLKRDGLTTVTMLGMVPRERVPGILAASDILLVSLKPSPMFEKVLPSKLFEAMAASRPIVLSVGGEARRVLEQAEAGIAVQPGNAEAIAAAIRALAADPDQRRRLGASGRAFVTREFTRDFWAGEMLRCLEGIATTHAAHRSLDVRAGH